MLINTFLPYYHKSKDFANLKFLNFTFKKIFEGDRENRLGAWG